MDLRDHKLSLLVFFVIFLLLYLPIMGRPLSFEELRLTTFFHSQPAEQVKVFLPEYEGGTRFAQDWRHYVALYPPGLMGFYYVWSHLSFGDEIFLRIPLLLLMLLCFKELYSLLISWLSKNEASLLLLMTGLFPLWYFHGSHITPESFNFFLVVLSFVFYLKAIKRSNLATASLWITNILGLLNSYFFIPLICSQILGSFLKKGITNRIPFLIVFVFSSVAIIAGYFSIVDNTVHNPLIFYWPDIEGDELKKFFELILMGNVRL